MRRFCTLSNWECSYPGPPPVYFRHALFLDNGYYSICYEYSKDGSTLDNTSPNCRAFGNMKSVVSNLYIALDPKKIKGAVDAIVGELVTRLNIIPSISIDDPYSIMTLDEVGEWIDDAFQTSLMKDPEKVLWRLFPDERPVEKDVSGENLIHDSLLCQD